MTATEVLELDTDLLSEPEREQIRATLNDPATLDHLPEAVRGFVATLLERVTEGHSLLAVSDDEALTTSQAARLIGCSRPHLVRLLDEGRLSHHLVGRDRRVTVSEVKRYLSERTRIAEQVAQARAARLPLNTRLVKEFGLDADKAARFGL